MRCSKSSPAASIQFETDIAAELLAKLLGQTPAFLERVVVELLVKMGYGGAEGTATVLGGSGGGGSFAVIYLRRPPWPVMTDSYFCRAA